MGDQNNQGYELDINMLKNICPIYNNYNIDDSINRDTYNNTYNFTQLEGEVMLLKDKYFRIVKILRKSKKKSNDLFTNNKKIFFKIKNIDLYIIASPTNSHYDYLKTALIKKKHIIIEKPLVGEFSQFTKIKGLIKKSKKIILINHTDLYMNAYLSLKKKIKKIGKIKSLKLIFGKIDPYPVKNITNKYKLPHFEWLPHPLAIMLDLIKDQNLVFF